MIFRRPRVNAPLVAAAVATLVCLLGYVGHHRWWEVPALDRLERNSVDARFRLRGGRAPDPRIVIVGIDDATRRAFPEVTQTRRGWAKLIDAIAAQHPKVVALDLFFSSKEIILRPELADRVRAEHDALATATDPDAQRARGVLGEVVDEMRGDDVLADAIARAGVIYLGMDFFLASSVAEIPDSPEEVAGTELARYGESAVAGGPNQPSIAIGVTVTRPSIGKGAAGAGMVNVIRDDDGVTRRLPMVVQHGDRHYLPMGLAVALAELGAPHDASYVGGEDHVTAAGRTLPLGDHASAVLDFLGPGKTFPHVSAASLLDGTADPAALDGKLVFVGLTYGAFDKVATPYDQLADGVELHATLAHDVLHGELLEPAGRGLSAGAIVVLGLAITALQLRRVRRRPWVPAVGAALLVVVWIAAAYAWFAEARLVVELIAPLGAAAVITVAASVTSLATEGREKAKLRAAFSQYVSSTLVERILAQPGLAHLGGERKELSVLFADIRSFSRFAETLEPEDLAAFLNEYLTPMTEIILDSSGTLDKYIGDAVMAIWGAPVDLADHATRACRAAIAMHAALGPLNARWKARGLPEIKIGVGLNTGAMAVGNMGSEARFDYTVLGDAVNLAARLEALTKEYGVDVLTGEGTAKTAQGYTFRELDWVRVVGRGGTAAIYELMTSPPPDADLATWADALAAYRARDFDRAVELWGDLAIRHPDDGPAAVMRARAEALRADPPAEGWDGVYAQRSK